MQMQRTPIILFAIAALLGGFVYFHETQAKPNREVQNQAKKLFPFEERDIRAFTLKTLVNTLTFTKAPAQTPQTAAATASTWRMIAPKNTIANDGAIAYLLNLIGTGTSEKTITAPAAQLAEFGLQPPFATVDVTLNNQKTHRLVLGKPDFNRTYLYAQIDPPSPVGSPNQPSNVTIHLVSLDFEQAVTRQLPEWEQGGVTRR